MRDARDGFVLHLVAASRFSGAAAPALDTVVALRRSGWDARFGFLGGYQLEERLDGIPWAAPLLTKPRSPWQVNGDIARLRRTIEDGCRLVHCHLNTDHLYAALALRRSTNPIPIVRTFHHESHGRRDPLHRWAFRRTAHFVTVSRLLERQLRPRLPSAARWDVIPVSVDPVRFAPRPRPRALASELGIAPDTFVVVHVGKVDHGRGQDVALALAAELDRRGVEVTFVLIGIGPLLAELERQSLTRRLRVVFPGYRESNLPELYNLADVALFPAAGSERGHRMILEALASGLPVVSLGVPGSDELIDDGVEGFVTSSRDLAAAAAALERLAADRSLRERMGDAGRRRVLGCFADPVLARRVGTLYDEILSDGGASADDSPR